LAEGKVAWRDNAIGESHMQNATLKGCDCILSSTVETARLHDDDPRACGLAIEQALNQAHILRKVGLAGSDRFG
jgi:hypothetical protein